MAFVKPVDQSFTLRDFLKSSTKKSLKKRTDEFYDYVGFVKKNHRYTYQRKIISATERVVEIWDDEDKASREMLMFASNNYLGLANHPYVKERVIKAMKTNGTGIGGPPLLNGYSNLMCELEERLAAMKQCESVMIFSSGYNANIGLISGLTQRNDWIIFDSLSHASFYDGLQLTKTNSVHFEHNNLNDLEQKLEEVSSKCKGDIFVATEGVFSMDGDLAPLDKIIPMLRKYNAILLLDDAHGTGIMGELGKGTAEHFNLENEIDLTLGTFSKTLAVTGGFLASSKEVINYLRYFARSYMFSASLPPISLAAVLGGLDVIEKEPWLREKLHENTQYAVSKLRQFGFYVEPEAAIIALKVPDEMNIRKANYEIHRRGIFLNAVEYPAVPLNEQRFRISMTALHTKEDIDKLSTEIEAVWNDENTWI
ncbi:MAG: pyridoxal phosphate-dependent aminotransferase family protein [Bacteroidetes bacterium]|nr:pyridoxal phosphate-dependent aminotransferase family protein [Bacteroidota bacterium]